MPISWKEREHRRFTTGEYKPLPVVLDYPPEHFVHLSVAANQTDYVAYTPSADKGERDIQTRLKYGRYLRKTFPELTDCQIESYVTALKSAMAVIETPAALHFATDIPTINDIFETRMSACGSTADSCMYGKWDGDAIRPYHVYAGSADVAVAYVMADGRIMARSVVSTKDKTWVRAYALSGSDNETQCGILKDLLKSAGYSKGELDGNRLSKLPENRNGQARLPYIDNSGRHVLDAGQYWVVCEYGGDYQCDNTNGTGTAIDRCERCERHTDDCQCVYCECCNESYADGCETCSMCEHCERCVTHDNCQCRRTWYRQCDRCGECGQLVNHYRNCNYCECERCDSCNELEENCECEDDDDSEDADEDTEDEITPVDPRPLKMTL